MGLVSGLCYCGHKYLLCFGQTVNHKPVECQLMCIAWYFYYIVNASVYQFICKQLFDGNSPCAQREQQRQLYTPVIAQYVRIIPLEWIGPMICFKMELYGCFVRGKYILLPIYLHQKSLACYNISLKSAPMLVCTHSHTNVCILFYTQLKEQSNFI